MFEIGYLITGLDWTLGSRRLRLPAFLDNWHRKVAKLSTLCTDHFYPPEDTPGVHFCYRLSRTYGYSAAGRNESIKNTSDLIGNRIRGLPTCDVVPQSTAPLSNTVVCPRHNRKIHNFFFYYLRKTSFSLNFLYQNKYLRISDFLQETL